MVFGPWAGNASRLFELAGDRNKATEAASKVTQILPVRGLLSCLLRSSTDILEHMAEDKGSIYLALGGPGVGKTSGRIVDCIQQVCREGKKRVLLISSLCQVRNMHVQMLVNTLSAGGFLEQVRVIGTHGLDKLAQSRTLPALVWQRMEPMVVQYEHRLTLLYAAGTRVVALAVLTRELEKFEHSQQEHIEFIVNHIESFGMFRSNLATMHQVVAYDRHELEGYVSTVEREIIASTRVLVSTVGSLLRNTALREVGCNVDGFSVLVLDESSPCFMDTSDAQACKKSESLCQLHLDPHVYVTPCAGSKRAHINLF